MTTIVTRSGKAAPLTNTELDANFTNLNTDKLEKGSNLSDLQSVSQARTNLGLGDLATQNKASLAGPVALTDSSTSPALKITQTGTGNALVVEDAASDSTPFVIDSAGRVGIGSAPYAGVNVITTQPITGNTVSSAFTATGTVQSDVTDRSDAFLSYVGTQAATFTLGNLRHFGAYQATIGAGSTVTNQYGFFADAGLVGATNNFGFFGNIPAGTGRYNFYAAGTADNYFAGNVGVGVTPTGSKFSVAQTAATHAVASLYNADATATYNTDLQINNGNVAGNALISRRTNGEFWMYTSAAHPIALWTNSAERLRIDSSGNVLVKSAAGLGYGTGAGGQVTQVTSKSTAVTLNTPTGQITMHNAALAAGASVIFQLTCDKISTGDTLIVSPFWSAVNVDNYRVEVVGVGTGEAKIRVTNLSGGSLSDALVINYAIIKGATA